MAFASGFSFWSFGLYIGPLEDEFGWSRAQVSVGFSVALLVSGITSPFVGRWIDVRGPRSSILVGALLASLTYLLLAVTSSLWQWYLFNAVNAVFRQMMFFIPFQTLVSRWFDARRGIALGILGTGFSMGGFLVVPLMRYVIDTLDWEGAFIFSAIATAAVFLPIGLFVVRNSPADVGAALDGRPRLRSAGVAGVAPAAGVSLPQAIRLPIFWLLALALMLLYYGMFGWTVHQIPFWESKGFSRETGVLLLSMAAGTGIVLRLALGAVSDRIRRFEHAAMAFAACLAVSLTVLLTSTSTAGIGVYFAFWIIGAAGGPMIEALVLSRAFGTTHFATILGTVVVVETIGQIVSPTVAGAIFDASGSYDWALIMFVAAFGLSFLLFMLASRQPRPVEQLIPERPLPAGG